MIKHLKKGEGVFYVLRRWHSFTPKIPSLESGPGGGYFLQWNGKGIAIDPGFDYINNMKNQGIDLKDIQAIAITHSHPDHTDNFEALLMMKHERIKRLERHGKGGDKPLDLFLSMDTAEKYRRVILDHQSGKTINKDKPPDLPIRDIISLPEYSLMIETIPTQHVKEISQSQLSPVRFGVGFIFHLYSDESMKHKIISIGITGDTRYDEKSMIDCFKKCEIVVAHLGSIDIEKLLFFASLYKTFPSNSKILKKLKDTRPKYLEEEAIQELLGFEKIQKDIKVTEILKKIFQGKDPRKEESAIGHMMFHGVFNLFSKLFNDSSSPLQIGIISEYDQYLGAFRHKIAESMNYAIWNNSEGTQGKKIISGDIGLTIKFGNKQKCAHVGNTHCKEKCLGDNTKLLFKCTLCKEWVCLSCIKGHLIKYYNEGIFYNCDIEYPPSFSPSIPLFHI